MEKTFCLVAFNSTHHAMRAEKILLDLGLPINIIPTPREISASCGLSISFPDELLSRIKDHLCEYHLEMAGFYRVERQEKHNRIERLE